MGAHKHWWRRWIERLGRRRAPERWADLESIVGAFEQHIGIQFINRALLQRALTHRSYLGGEEAHGPDSNERLEFLGDAVLELIVIESLYQRYPKAREGDLTKKKSLLVSRSVLADCAEVLDLGRFILLSDAERGSGGGERSSILADAFEAVLGAIYIDQGLPVAQRFVTRWLLGQAEAILHDDEKQNFKSILQESIQARLRIHPRYRIFSEEGPDHEKRFTVNVLVRGEVLGTGRGHNKKEAEQQAAREALESGALERWLQGLDDAGAETDSGEGDS
jgi:ribonuclease III